MTITHDFKYHLNVRDEEGNVLESGVSYTVFTAGTITAATIYSDPVRTAKTNPVLASVFATDKGCTFWAATATVDVLVKYGDLGNRRSLILTLTPSSAHNVILPIQEISNRICVTQGAFFDCGLASAAAAIVIVPAVDNPRGIIPVHIFAVVEEAFAGTEDQGIVTVSDESNNALATLTATNASSDAIGDYLLGLQLQSTASDAAINRVAAGEFIDAIVTQLTTGSNTGQMTVYMEYIRL